MNLSKEDREYVPTSFDLQCMAEAEWLENLHKPKPYQKKKNPPKKKAKPKMKQPTLKQVVKKMTQNSQVFRSQTIVSKYLVTETWLFTFPVAMGTRPRKGTMVLLALVIENFANIVTFSHVP